MPKQAAKFEGEPKFNLAALRNSGFEDAPRAHLLKAYALLAGDEADEHISDAELAAECRRMTGISKPADMAPEIGEEPIPPGEPGNEAVPAPNIVNVGRVAGIPRLGPETFPEWDGRKRKVQFAALASEQQKTITLGWDARSKWVIEVPGTYDMPWPYWECLKNMYVIDDRSDKVRKFLRDDESGKLYTVTKPTRRPVYQYVDLGDTPGTEDLPTSYFEWAQREAMRTQIWRGYGRPALMRLYRLLRDDPGSSFFERKTNVDIRVALATILGPEYLAIMDAEVYDEGPTSA